MSENEFEATYAGMLDGELARVYRERHTLVPEAKAALEAELERRHLDPNEVHRRYLHDGPNVKLPKRLASLRRMRLHASGLSGLLVASFALIAILDHFGQLQQYWPICYTTTIAVFTMWGYWDLRRRPWPWMVAAFVLLLHVLLFWRVGWPWGTRWVPAASITGFASLELIGIYWVMARIEKAIAKRNRSHAGGDENEH